MRNPTAKAVIAAALIAVPLSAFADLGFHVGANVGSARVNEGDFEGDDTGWKAHIGSSFHEFIGAEIGYVNFGEFGSTSDREFSAWAPAFTLGVPLGGVRLYGKGGIAFADIEGASADEEYSNEDPFYGVGLRVGMRNGLGVRAEYERYEFGPSDLDMAQVGLDFSFGGERRR